MDSDERKTITRKLRRRVLIVTIGRVKITIDPSVPQVSATVPQEERVQFWEED